MEALLERVDHRTTSDRSCRHQEAEHDTSDRRMHPRPLSTHPQNDSREDIENRVPDPEPLQRQDHHDDPAGRVHSATSSRGGRRASGAARRQTVGGGRGGSSSVHIPTRFRLSCLTARGEWFCIAISNLTSNLRSRTRQHATGVDGSTKARTSQVSRTGRDQPGVEGRRVRKLITRRSKVQILPPPPSNQQVKAGAHAPAFCIGASSSANSSAVTVRPSS